MFVFCIMFLPLLLVNRELRKYQSNFAVPSKERLLKSGLKKESFIMSMVSCL